VRLDEIGDVVMTMPLLRELRRSFSSAWITLIVKPDVFNLVALCPYINEVLTYDGNTPQRFEQARRHSRAMRLGRRELWPRRFDLAIVPRWGVDLYHAGFVAYFSGASLRLSYSETVSADKARVNKGSNALFTHLLNDDSPKHEVERNLEIVRYLGGEIRNDKLELWLDENDERFAEDILSSNDINPAELVVALAPGAGAAKRMWPLKNYIELAEWLRDDFHARLIIVGGPEDRPLGQELQTRLPKLAINVTGRSSLRQTFALLKHCDLYIGNDTGPMHLAAAADVPVVEISCHPKGGSPNHTNSPLVYGPWGVSHLIAQPSTPLHPCEYSCIAAEAHCILGISTDEVKRAIRGLVGKRPLKASFLEVGLEDSVSYLIEQSSISNQNE